MSDSRLLIDSRFLLDETLVGALDGSRNFFIHGLIIGFSLWEIRPVKEFSLFRGVNRIASSPGWRLQGCMTQLFEYDETGVIRLFSLPLPLLVEFSFRSSSLLNAGLVAFATF